MLGGFGVGICVLLSGGWGFGRGHVFGGGAGGYCLSADYARIAGWTRFGQCRGGLGFVWTGGIALIAGVIGAEFGQVFGGAAVFAQEAGLVAAEEFEIGGRGGQGGQAGVVDGGAYDLIEDSDLDGLGAAQAPEGGDHLFDVSEFGVIGGLKSADEVLEQGVELGRIFAGHDHGLREKPVAGGVEPGYGFALGCDGAARAGAISTGSFDLGWSAHNALLSPSGYSREIGNSGGNWDIC
jgi:hypothetical protein